jgi:hypothetical protein
MGFLEVFAAEKDACLQDLLMRGGIGFAVGLVFAGVLKGRLRLVSAGFATGVGAGSAVTLCSLRLNRFQENNSVEPTVAVVSDVGIHVESSTSEDDSSLR